MANSLTKALSIIKYEYFVKIIGIENKRELWASIKWKDDFRDAFQQWGTNISKLFGFGIITSLYI